LAIVGSTLEKIAVEIRHLQKTEVLEVEEYFEKGQKGSSAMPHKRNPIVSERIAGLARILRANASSGFENVALWHERDISHSSVERVILPDSTILLDYMLRKTIRLIENLLVYPEKMIENLGKTGGLIFSQSLLLTLVKKGMAREDGYRIVQKVAMECWKNREEFQKAVQKDPEIQKLLSVKEIEACFDLRVQLRNIDYLFQRVGLLKG
jgi:adenylosuccinate lyase